MRKRVKVELAPSSVDTVIEIDGVDITSAVQGVTISHEPGSLPMVTLRCLLDDHRAEYEGPARVARELVAELPLVAEVELADRIERHRRELERMTDRPVIVCDAGRPSIGDPAFLDVVQGWLDGAGFATLRWGGRIRAAIASDAGLQLSAGILGAIAFVLFAYSWDSRSFLAGLAGSLFATGSALALGIWIRRGIRGLDG